MASLSLGFSWQTDGATLGPPTPGNQRPGQGYLDLELSHQRLNGVGVSKISACPTDDLSQVESTFHGATSAWASKLAAANIGYTPAI